MDDLDYKSESWNDMRERCIENAIQLPDDAPYDVKRIELRSQSMRLMGDFLDEGIRLAKERGEQPGSENAWETLAKASQIASSIIWAGALMRLPYSQEDRAKLTKEDARRAFSITHEASPRSLVADAAKGKSMQVDRAELEESVSAYLRSDFRIPFADRVLLIALVDMEITAYLQEIYEKDFYTNKSAASVMRRKPIVTWLLGRGWAALMLALIAAAIIASANYDWIAVDTAFFLILGALALFMIGTVWSFVSYLFYRQRWKSLRPKLVEIPSEMISFYRELHSAGPLSVKRVGQQAQKLSDIGAVWSGGVWALIDDMQARGVIVIT